MNDFKLNLVATTEETLPAALGISDERNREMASAATNAIESSDSYAEALNKIVAACTSLNEVAFYCFATGGWVEKEKSRNPLARLATLFG